MPDRATDPARRRAELGSLDPDRDDQRIVHLLACYEFPWELTRSLELALFRTFCDPAISGLLARTGEFPQRAQQRYDDTDLLVSALLEHGYDSDLGAQALQKINEQHGRFRIPNEDFLYVLSTFVLEPIRFNARFGWRRMSARERQAWFRFWSHVAARMGIRGVPADCADLERFNRAHERARFRFAPSNRQVGSATMAMFASWFPRPMRGLVDAGLRALMDQPMLEGFGFERPGAVVRGVVAASLQGRGLALRLLPKRRRPRLRTVLRHRSYPDGYTIPALGPSGADG